MNFANLEAMTLALFPPLAALAAVATAAFWGGFLIPMARAGRLSLQDHKLPIAVGFLVAGLLGETLLYGYGRFTGDYSAVARLFPLVAALKLSYLVGLVFGAAWLWRLKTGRSHVAQVGAMAAAVWLGALLAVLLLPLR